MKRRQFTKTLAAIPLLGVVPFLKYGPQDSSTLHAMRETLLAASEKIVDPPLTELFIQHYQDDVRAIFMRDAGLAWSRITDDRIMRELQ